MIVALNNVVLCAAFLAGNYVRRSFNANTKSELKALCISCCSNVVLSLAKLTSFKMIQVDCPKRH